MTNLQNWVAEQLRCDSHDVDLQSASADASFRRYYRVNLRGESLIVMDASAESASCGPFIRIAQLLAGGGLHVPRIIAAAPERGWMVLSDLGTQTYLDAFNSDSALNKESAEELFDAAIDALIAQQKIACPDDFPQYDAALLRRELELFPDWYLQKHLRIDVDTKLRAQLDVVFDLLITQILQQPKVFVHRDFMPRNLMISDPMPGLLDFQDAVLGPIAYDPICLFKDAFISWSEASVEKWLRIYWRRARSAQLPVSEKFEDFYRDCDFIGTQRHLKVIGIFARICHRDGKPKYVGDVPRFFNYLRGACARRSEFAPLAALLDQLNIDRLSSL